MIFARAKSDHSLSLPEFDLAWPPTAAVGDPLPIRCRGFGEGFDHERTFSEHAQASSGIKVRITGGSNATHSICPGRKRSDDEFGKNLYFTNSDTELVKTLEIDAEITRDHGTMNVPVRLPRHLMPEWSQDEWIALLRVNSVCSAISLTKRSWSGCPSRLRPGISCARKFFKTSNAVVIDFRGDIPNGWFAMMWEGYKIGVYRSGQGWPIWMSIAPTYDLAIEEAKKLRDQAGLPKKLDTSNRRTS